VNQCVPNRTIASRDWLDELLVRQLRENLEERSICPIAVVKQRLKILGGHSSSLPQLPGTDRFLSNHGLPLCHTSPPQNAAQPFGRGVAAGVLRPLALVEGRRFHGIPAKWGYRGDHGRFLDRVFIECKDLVLRGNIPESYERRRLLTKPERGLTV
jgi:hypothetical protein